MSSTRQSGRTIRIPADAAAAAATPEAPPEGPQTGVTVRIPASVALAAATPEAPGSPESTQASDPTPDSPEVSRPAESQPSIGRRAVAKLALRSRTAASTKPRPALLLVDADRFGRPALARALVRAQWDVTPVDSVEELVEALRTGERVRAVVVDEQHPSAPTIFAAIASACADVVVVVRSSDEAASRSALTASGLTRFDVRSREAPADALVDALRAASPL